MPGHQPMQSPKDHGIPQASQLPNTILCMKNLLETLKKLNDLFVK